MKSVPAAYNSRTFAGLAALVVSSIVSLSACSGDKQVAGPAAV